jgi:hypothetical protein
MFAKPDQFPFYIPAKFIRLIKKNFNTRAQWQVFKPIRKNVCIHQNLLEFIDWEYSGCVLSRSSRINKSSNRSSRRTSYLTDADRSTQRLSTGDSRQATRLKPTLIRTEKAMSYLYNGKMSFEICLEPTVQRRKPIYQFTVSFL